MKKRFKTIVIEISKLEEEIQSISIRKAEAEQRVNEAEVAIKTLQKDLKGALVADDQRKAKTLEKEISKLSSKIITRDRLLVEGLNEKLPEIEKQLAEAKEHKNKTFSKLAQKWLESEVLAYDSTAKTLVEKIRRILLVHSMLRNIGATEVYCQSVGPGYEILPAARIPKLRDFNRQEFLSGSFRSGSELRNKVFDEIAK